jgi:hypothetical protein
VIHLLNQLQTDDKIKLYQKEKMLPIQNKTQLAYMYFLPKPHKVNFWSVIDLFQSNTILF